MVLVLNVFSQSTLHVLQKLKLFALVKFAVQNFTTSATKSVRTQKSKNLSLKRIRIINLNILKNEIPFIKTDKGISTKKPAEAGFFSSQKQVSLSAENTVLIKDGKTTIININNKSFLQLPEVKTFFEKLGLPCDTTSLHLIQFFQQFEIKPELPKLIKCYNLAKKFPKNEGKAAEIAFLLEEKNISADEEKIQNVLVFLDSDKEQKQNDKDSKEKDFLKLINHKTGKNKYWLIFPYELKLENDTGDGVIRLLCDRSKKNTEKMIISAKFSRIFYNFVIYFKNSKHGNKSLTIDFCTKPELSLLKKRNSIKILQEIFAQQENTRINYCKYDDEETEFFSADSQIAIIQDDL